MPYSILEQLEASDKPLDVKRVAAIFDVSEKTIRKHVDQGILPCIRLGSALKFDPSALGYWIRKQNPTFAAARREAMKNQPAD